MTSDDSLTGLLHRLCVMLTVTSIPADVLAEVSVARVTTEPSVLFVDDQHGRRHHPWEYGESTFLRLGDELRR